MKKNKIFNLALTILIAVLYSYLFTFYSFVLRAYFKLSRWPFYKNPNPELLNFTFHRDLVYQNLYYSIISFCLIIVLIIASCIVKTKVHRVNWFLLILAVFIILYNLFLDPFMEWFAD